MNRNTNFNIEQILDILAELESGKVIVSELIEHLSQFEELVESTKSELSNMGCVSEEICSKIDKNVVYLMDQSECVMNASVLLRKVSTKKMDLLQKLAKGIKYSYKLKNNVTISNPEYFKFDAIVVDPKNNIIKIGNKVFQFSGKSDFVNDCSEVSELIVDDQFSDDEDELPDLDDPNLDGLEDLEELCDEQPHNYEDLATNLAYVLNTAYKAVNYYYDGTDYFEKYFAGLVEAHLELGNLIRNGSSKEVSAAIFEMNNLNQEARQELELDLDAAACTLLCPYFTAIDYYLDRAQKLLQKLIDASAPNASGPDQDEVECYLELMDKEIEKARVARACLDLNQKSICYIKESIECDVKHFQLFDCALLEDLCKTY